METGEVATIPVPVLEISAALDGAPRAEHIVRTAFAFIIALASGMCAAISALVAASSSTVTRPSFSVVEKPDPNFAFRCWTLPRH